MAAVPQATLGGPPDPPPTPPLTWDGDRMFNIYIFDYCQKRGFLKTADQLKIEAGLDGDNHPPINAKQGLLFEWWSVFWVLFSAKSSGSPNEDAMLYTQHQAAQAAQRPPFGTRPTQPQPPPPQQLPRYVNGASRQPGAPGAAPIPNGVVPNGIPAGPPSGMPNGNQGPVPFGVAQVNGVPGSSGIAAGAPTQAPSMQHLMPGQRPGAPPQRVPNGVAPFQSPTLAHSPQNPGVPGNPPPMGQLGASQPPLTQMARGGMLPPNGPQGPMPPSQHTPQQGFQPLGRSPSQPSSPGPNMIARSPSLNPARHTPSMLPPESRQMHEVNALNAVNAEISRIPPQLLSQLKEEAGLGDKDFPSLTLEDKQRILGLYKLRQMKGQPVRGGPPNAIAGPSNATMQPPMQPLMQPQRNPQPLQQSTPQQQPRGSKRSSTSPGQDPEQLPRSDTSPPDRKRMRRSPANSDQSQPPPQNQQPPMTPLGPVPYPHPPQQGGPMNPQQMVNGGMMGRPMGGFPGQPGMPNMGGNPGMSIPMGASIGGPQLGVTMSPGMMNHAGPGGMMTPQMYRQSMQNIHKTGMQHSGLAGMVPGGNAGSPPAGDGGFVADGPQSRPGTAQFAGAPGVNPRMPQGKQMGMGPPPSPSPGNAKVGQKDAGPGEAPPNGRLDASPQTGAAGQSAPGSAPPGTHTGPSTPSSSGNMTAPSPSAMLNTVSTPSMNANHAPVPPATDSILSGLFPTDFMPQNGLDDFDTSLFRQDGDLNFERDFGEWFNPDNVGLDSLK